jgi:hypothetical protein
MAWSKETERTMPKKKYRFVLTQEERDELEAIVAKGKHNSQKVINAFNPELRRGFVQAENIR